MIEPYTASLTVQKIAPDDGYKSLSLRLSGNLTGESVRVLKQAVEPIFISPTPPQLRLLMDDVIYMDSSGVGIIISIIQRMRSVGGKLEIHGLSDIGRELFQILRLARLNEIVTVVKSRE